MDEWKIDQIENQIIIQKLTEILTKKQVDFVINNGDLSTFLSRRISSLTVPEKYNGPIHYICAFIPYNIFDLTFLDKTKNYSSKYIKSIFLDWYPKTFKAGEIIYNVIKQNKQLRIPKEFTNDQQIIMVMLRN